MLFQSLILAFLIQIIPGTMQSATAKKPHSYKYKTNQSYIRRQNNQSIRLNQSQSKNLVDVLKGRSHNFNLNPTIRVEINNGVNSLPPGIQKKLARGKTLPPGIAKKVILPKKVNSQLNLSSDK